MNNICPHYDIWKERSVIADCLDDLDLPNLAKEALEKSANGKLMERLLDIIEFKAKKQNRHDVLERLYFAGLIYG